MGDGDDVIELDLVDDPVVPPRIPRRVVSEKPKRRRKTRWAVDRETCVALGIGATLAAVALSIPILGFIISVLITVIHELGHSATSWVLAGPALPSFDLTYGGGYSLSLPRQPLLVAVGCGWFAFAIVQARGDRPALIKWAVGAAIYAVALFTPLRDPVISAMGHGSELIFAGIFLYRALSNHQILRSEERPLYAALGLFIVAYDVRFAYSLITSEDFSEEYGDAKGGGHWMDFDQIATDFGWSLPSVARLFLIACALTPVASYLAYSFRRK